MSYSNVLQKKKAIHLWHAKLGTIALICADYVQYV